MGHLGNILRHLGHLGTILGPSWAILNHLGTILGPSWAILGPSWAILGGLWAILGGLRAILEGLGGVLVGVQTHFQRPSKTSFLEGRVLQPSSRHAPKARCAGSTLRVVRRNLKNLYERQNLFGTENAFSECSAKFEDFSRVLIGSSAV